MVEFLQIQIPTDRTSGTRTRATQMLTNTIVEIYSTALTTAPRPPTMNLIEQTRYKAALIVSGRWQSTCRGKLYDELGWESLTERRWARRQIMSYKISNGMAPIYQITYLSVA